MASLTPAAGFLSFPLEIIRAILKFLTGKDLKILRLVCTQLNIVIEPNLLSSLYIYESSLTPDICLLQLLAAGKTRATLHVRQLMIDLSDVSWSASWGKPEGFDEIHSTEDHIKKYLGSALSSLRNLDCLVWSVDGDDPDWTLHTIVDAIAHLPLLQDFQLLLSSNMGSSHPRLDRLSGLKKISLHGMCGKYSNLIGKLAIAIAKSPHLTHLEIDLDGRNWGFARETLSLRHLLVNVPPGTALRLTHLALHDILCRIDAFTLPHLRSLVSLDLSRLPGGRTPNSSTLSNIFAVLTREKIHLRHIVVDTINDAVLSYLESYSSVLERLEMISIHCTSTDALAERFYSSALPKHAETIQVLKILPTFKGEWCYGPQMATTLSQCQRLASLIIVVHPSTVPAQPSRSSDPSDGLYGFDHMFRSIADLSLRLPRLEEVDLKSVKDGPDNYDSMFTSIADFSLMLLRLREVNLKPANPELYRDAQTPTSSSPLCTIRVSRALLPRDVSSL